MRPKAIRLQMATQYIGSNAILEGVFARLHANHEYFGLQDVKIHGMSDNKGLATLRYDAKEKVTG